MGTNIKARRKLSELYLTGTEIRFGPKGPRVGRLTKPYFDEPADPEDVVMFIGPCSPFYRQEGMSRAQARRAAALIATKREVESEEHLTAKAFLVDMSLDTLIDYVLMTSQDDRRNEAIRDVLGRDEWKDMVVLQDAMAHFEEDETPSDDPEYAALLEKDALYGKQVSEKFLEITDSERASLVRLNRDQLESRALDQRAELVGSQRFMETFELMMTYYSIRDPEATDVLFFDSPRELQEQPDEVQETIKDALRQFIDDPVTAKNSQGAASGSEPSTLPSEPEISEASIPEAVSV